MSTLESIRRAEKELDRRFEGKLVINRDLDRTLVRFQANKKQTCSRWFKYKEGFSAALVRYLLDKLGIDSGRLLYATLSPSVAFIEMRHCLSSRFRQQIEMRQPRIALRFRTHRGVPEARSTRASTSSPSKSSSSPCWRIHSTRRRMKPSPAAAVSTSSTCGDASSSGRGKHTMRLAPRPRDGHVEAVQSVDELGLAQGELRIRNAVADQHGVGFLTLHLVHRIDERQRLPFALRGQLLLNGANLGVVRADDENALAEEGGVVGVGPAVRVAQAVAQRGHRAGRRGRPRSDWPARRGCRRGRPPPADSPDRDRTATSGSRLRLRLEGETASRHRGVAALVARAVQKLAAQRVSTSFMRKFSSNCRTIRLPKICCAWRGQTASKMERCSSGSPGGVSG